MGQLDDLAPDRRAVLSLLVKQGKTYAELAGILHTDAVAVRVRAHDALASLAPRGAAGPDEAHREQVADYLLGQQSASERAATRSTLERSAPARAWARVIASELRPLAGDGLPEIPADGSEMDEAFDALQAREAAREEVRRGSRLGGVLLLGGLGILIAVVAVLLLTGGGSSSKGGSAAVSATAGPSTTAPASTTPQVIGQVNLSAPHGGHALGIANVLTLNGQLAVAMQAQGLTPTSTHAFYAVWLYNGPRDAQRLGFAPPVSRDGRLQATSTLSAAQSRFHHLIITRETARAPASPGPIVLQGTIVIPAS